MHTYIHTPCPPSLPSFVCVCMCVLEKLHKPPPRTNARAHTHTSTCRHMVEIPIICHYFNIFSILFNNLSLFQYFFNIARAHTHTSTCSHRLNLLFAFQYFVTISIFCHHLNFLSPARTAMDTLSKYFFFLKKYFFNILSPF